MKLNVVVPDFPILSRNVHIDSIVFIVPLVFNFSILTNIFHLS